MATPCEGVFEQFLLEGGDIDGDGRQAVFEACKRI